MYLLVRVKQIRIKQNKKQFKLIKPLIVNDKTTFIFFKIYYQKLNNYYKKKDFTVYKSSYFNGCKNTEVFIQTITKGFPFNIKFLFNVRFFINNT